MKTQTLLLSLLGLVSSSVFALNSGNEKSSGLSSSKMNVSSQILFTENKGQVKNTDGTFNPDVKFTSGNRDLNLFLMRSGICYQFKKVIWPQGSKKKFDFEHPNPPELQVQTFRMDMELQGANPDARISTEREAGGLLNYYTCNVLQVSSYAKLTYHDIYPGIDWVVYEKAGAIKYDFVVKPGADPALIKLKFRYHEKISLNSDGSFSLESRLGSVKESAPVSFQNGKEIHTAFALRSDVLSFTLSEYDHQQTLVIDPVLSWATYYGDNDNDVGGGCAVDAAGNVYMSGHSVSTSGIASGGFQMTNSGGMGDAFLAKFTSAGSRLWATYYGGSDVDYYTSCAVDASGNVYMAGTTQSTNGIASSGHQNAIANPGVGDAFLVKFDNNGLRLWGTYYGGSGTEFGHGCATDALGNVYLCGRTGSSSGISANGLYNSIVTGYDCFLVQFNSSGIRQWGTYYPSGGGLAEVGGLSVCTDNSNNVYMAGVTSVATGVALNGHQNTYGGGKDGLLVKFNSAGVRQWATYYGDTGDDIATACVADQNGNVYLGGYTNSTGNIAASGYQSALSGSYDGFLAKFNSSGVRQWATYYGGTGMDQCKAITVDGSGNVYMGGATASTVNIAFMGYQNTYGGGIYDMFVTKFDSSGTRKWATYSGGPGTELMGADDYVLHSNAIACDASDNIYFAGATNSQTLLASNGFQNNYGGGPDDAVLVKLGCSMNSSLSVSGPAESVCPQQMVILTATAADATTWSWTTGATTNTISVAPAATSVYTVTATDANGCSARTVFTVNVQSCTGIAQQEASRKTVLIYPNPVNEEFFIESEDKAEITIYNALGQIVAHEQLSPGKSKIVFDKMKSGIYVVKLCYQGTEETRKIVK